MEQHAINYSLDYSSLDLKTLDFSKNIPEKKESGEAFESKKSFDDYEEALAYVEREGTPIVINSWRKPIGLPMG